jgi:CDP-4-dehydro-6-deoxyglucose reductase, E1
MKIRLNEPTFGQEEIQAAVDVMNSSYVTQGIKVEEFEERFAEYTGFKYAVAVNSGSSANLLAVSALKAVGALRDGAEVIVPALTWSTTIWPLVQHDLVPVFLDCDPDTLNMVDNAHHTYRSVVAVPVYGNPATVQDRKVTMYDCCEALGTPKPRCDVATYSFYFSHHITTFEGGMVCTDNEALSDMLRIQRSHGWIRDVRDKQKYIDENPDIDPRFLFVDLGYNLRMTDVAAAVGLVQLGKLDHFVERRRIVDQMYRDKLGKYEEFLRFQRITPDSSCFSFAMTVKDNAPFTVNGFRDFLTSKGIENRPIIAGNMARQPGMKKYKHRTIGDLPNADNVMRNGLSIGNHQEIRSSDIEYVAESIEEMLCGL